MIKILKLSIIIFIFTLLFTSFSANAEVHNIATKRVNLPILSTQRTVARYEKQINFSDQYFMTGRCTNNSTGNDQLVEVQTYMVSGGDYSVYYKVPKHERVLLDEHKLGGDYKLNARVVDKIWNTVDFYGIWQIN